MNTFKLDPTWRICNQEAYIDIDIYIDGKNLIEIAREIELPYASREGSPDIAGQYSSLTKYEVKSFENFFLQDPKFEFTNCEDVYLLECGACRIWACWALWAKIIVQNDTVIWKDFRNHHRDKNAGDRKWNYDKMGPYCFNKVQYIEELKRGQAQHDDLEKRYDVIVPPLFDEYYENRTY